MCASPIAVLTSHAPRSILVPRAVKERRKVAVLYEPKVEREREHGDFRYVSPTVNPSRNFRGRLTFDRISSSTKHSGQGALKLVVKHNSRSGYNKLPRNPAVTFVILL